MKMADAVAVTNLSKQYGRHQVFKYLDFQVKQGEIFGILGMNGAGKTTLLECMEGLRDYDSGTVKMNGSIGIQLQSASIPSYMKGKEAVRLIAGWKKAGIQEEILCESGMEELKEKGYAEMSTGQKRRLHLALALIGDPDILFLDEPAAGLDVEGRIRLHRQIRRLREKGKTILLASHDMGEVENLCDRIMILHKGTILFCGTVDELSKRMGKCYQIEILTTEGTQKFEAKDIGESMLDILEDYKSKNIKIRDIKISRGTLEQHFLELMEGGSR